MTAHEILEPFRDHNRLLLLLAPAVQSPAYEKQMNQFSGMEEECRRCDLVLGHLLHEGESRIGKMMLDDGQASALRRHFAVEDENFLAVLLDKDGSEMKRYEAPVAAKAVFALIHAPEGERAEVEKEA